MNVNSINCQPIRQYTASPSFGARKQKSEIYADSEIDSLEALKREREEYSELAKDKSSPVTAAIGKIGVSAVAGAVSFATFKAVAPKGFQTLHNMYKKVADSSIVKKAATGIKNFFKTGKEKTINFVKSLKEDSFLGKTRDTIAKGINTIKEKTSPFFAKIKEGFNKFITKHNYNKETAKTALLNTGATAAALPAAITAANLDKPVEGDEE